MSFVNRESLSFVSVKMFLKSAFGEIKNGTLDGVSKMIYDAAM